MSAMTGVAVLGCTGSIGESTLDVLRRHPARYRAVALLAHRNVELLVRQAQEFHPDVVAIADATHEEDLRARLRQAGAPGFQPSASSLMRPTSSSSNSSAKTSS